MFFIPFSSLSKIDQMWWSYVIINTNLVLRNTKFACLNTAEYEISLQIYQIYIVLIVWHQWGSTHLMHQFHVNLFIALELKLFLFLSISNGILNVKHSPQMTIKYAAFHSLAFRQTLVITSEIVFIPSLSYYCLLCSK